MTLNPEAPDLIVVAGSEEVALLRRIAVATEETANSVWWVALPVWAALAILAVVVPLMLLWLMILWLTIPSH